MPPAMAPLTAGCEAADGVSHPLAKYITVLCPKLAQTVSADWAASVAQLALCARTLRPQSDPPTKVYGTRFLEVVHRLELAGVEQVHDRHPLAVMA
jgi:hypothetical protein